MVTRRANETKERHTWALTVKLGGRSKGKAKECMFLNLV